MDGKTIRGKKSGGGSAIEFVFVSLVLVPLFLGTGAVGVNLIRTLQTIQLARDIGHMYARGIDFSQVSQSDGYVSTRLQPGSDQFRAPPAPRSSSCPT